MLLDNGVNINLYKKNGYGFFYVVCFGGYENMIKFLLNNGVNINEGMIIGKSFLYMVCCLGYDVIV